MSTLPFDANAIFYTDINGPFRLQQKNLMTSLHSFSNTRMHSSRMCTARLMPISPSMHCSGGVYLPGGVPVWGVYLPGGVPAWGWGVPAQKGYLPGGCTCPGVYLPEGGVLAGGYLPRGRTYTGEYLLRYSPPMDRILDTRY